MCEPMCQLIGVRGVRMCQRPSGLGYRAGTGKWRHGLAAVVVPAMSHFSQAPTSKSHTCLVWAQPEMERNATQAAGLLSPWAGPFRQSSAKQAKRPETPLPQTKLRNAPTILLFVVTRHRGSKVMVVAATGNHPFSLRQFPHVKSCTSGQVPSRLQHQVLGMGANQPSTTTMARLRCSLLLEFWAVCKPPAHSFSTPVSFLAVEKPCKISPEKSSRPDCSLP